MFNASDILSNALQEIDDIITETEMELNNEFIKNSNLYTKDEKKNQIKNLLDNLIELTKDDDLFDIDNRKRLIDWLRELKNNKNYYTDNEKDKNGYNNTQLLESEISVLKDQIEAQQDKIKEYEVKISELAAQLVIRENTYQEIVKQKCEIEDEKLNLINELTRIKTINDNKIRLLDSEISFFKKTLLERETEIATLRLHLAKLVRASNHLITEEIDSLQSLSRSSESLSKKQNDNRISASNKKPPIAPRNQHFHMQPQFKDSSLTGSFTMPSSTNGQSNKQNQNIINNSLLQNQFLIKSSTPVLNDRRCLSPINRLDLATSKEQLEHLEDFCKQGEVNNYYAHQSDDKSFQNYSSNQFNYFNQSSNSSCSTPNRSAKSSSSTSQNNSLPKSSGNYLKDSLFNNFYQNMQFKRSMVSKSNDQISLKSDQTSIHSYLRRMNSSNFSSGSNLNANYLNKSTNSYTFQPNSYTLPSQTNSFASLSLGSTNSSSVFGGSIKDLIAVRSRPFSFSFSSNNRNTIFGRLPFSSWLKKNSKSAPDLADDSKLAYISIPKSSNPDLTRHLIGGKDNLKSKGLKWFFDKMKNNKNQHNLQNSLSFSRTSLRNTIGIPQRRNRIDINQSFNKWDSNLVSEWFNLIGLGNYSETILRLSLNGEQLLNLSDLQLEKLIKNHFHRKKLKLSIQVINKTCDSQTLKASKLDYICVAKWLDDIGLPQYKEIFLENRICGVVLNNLTVDDLIRLKITLHLHHSSFKTGILVLRLNSFNANCFIRRAPPNTKNIQLNSSNNSNDNQLNIDTSFNYDSNEELALWSSHRVMEWLKSIDLAEYVANLRGAGVHGALITFEDSFNSNVLATLLSIPVGKSLLRRHISTYFTQLIGYDISNRKRQYQDKIGNSQISAFTKVKIKKSSNFRNSFRKKKNENINVDLVCPLETLQENNIRLNQHLNNLFNSNNSSNYSINSNNSTNAIHSTNLSSNNRTRTLEQHEEQISKMTTKNLENNLTKNDLEEQLNDQLNLNNNNSKDRTKFSLDNDENDEVNQITESHV